MKRIRIVAALIALGLAVGCAVNPATGKRELALISEQDEIRLGMETDKQVVTQLGMYDDPELQEYIQRLGAKLAATSERPELDWTFRVVDDPSVNAFALPGGYIYITRGIMAHMNTEAELASVVGHEIGHVTARHGVSQMSKAQLAQMGMGLGMILAPELAQQFGNLAQTGLQLLFLKYSRDDERQADDLGLRYLVRGEYDPRPMTEMFEVLQRVSEGSEGGRLPGWLSTHPLPENRRERISEQIASMGEDFGSWPTNQEAFFAQIDNIMFGANPREGYFKGNVFFHPEMQFRFDFPENWQTQNQKQAVLAISPDRDALVQITLSPKPTVSESLRAFFEQQGVTRGRPIDGRIANLPTAGQYFTAQSGQTQLAGLVAFVEYRNLCLSLMGYTPRPAWDKNGQAIRSAVASFQRLSDPAALAVEPKRLRIVRAPYSMDLESFARAYDSTVSPEVLALINHLEPGETLQAGRSYKVVVGGRIP